MAVINIKIKLDLLTGANGDLNLYTNINVRRQQDAEGIQNMSGVYLSVTLFTT